MKTRVNYHMLFVAGCVMTAAGIVMLVTLSAAGAAIMSAGVCLMVIGLSGRSRDHEGGSETDERTERR